MFRFYALGSLNNEMRTHENKDTVGVLLPALGHVIVLCLCEL